MKYQVAAALLFVVGCSGGAASEFTGGAAGAGGGTSAGATSGGAGGGGAFAPLQATAIAVGAAHSCALLSGGHVACWGDGSLGQLGDGMSGTGYHRPVPGLVPGLEGVKLLRAGGNTTCAVLSDGVRCWGDGAFGQLGDGMSSDGYFSAAPVAVKDLGGVVDLSLSGSNACVALGDGTVRCWGRNSPEDWLGFDSADCGPYAMPMTGPMLVPCEAAPRKVPGATGAVAVASGGEHNCSRTSTSIEGGGGGASCWGADDFGQLGDGLAGPGAHDATPTPITGLTGIERLALGASHTCAVLGTAARVRCWGDNSFGQIGIGTNAIDSYQTKPIAVPSLMGVADLSAAGHTTCAALAGGTVACWGDTTFVLPVSPEKNGAALVPTAVPGTSGAIEVRTSGDHVCARLTDQSVVCWGSNQSGQLGNGTMGLADFSMVPVAMGEVSGTPG